MLHVVEDYADLQVTIKAQMELGGDGERKIERRERARERGEKERERESENERENLARILPFL